MKAEAGGQAAPQAHAQAGRPDDRRPGPDRGRAGRHRRSHRRPTEPSPTPGTREPSAAAAPRARVDRRVRDVGRHRGGAAWRSVSAAPGRRTAGQTARSARVMRGDVVGPNGKVARQRLPGLHRLDARVRVASLSTLWLWIDTPEGQYKYAADAALTPPRRPRRTTGRPRTSSRAGTACRASPATARHTDAPRRDDRDRAGVLGRRDALRDQRLHGRILSRTLAVREQPWAPDVVSLDVVHPRAGSEAVKGVGPGKHLGRSER